MPRQYIPVAITELRGQLEEFRSAYPPRTRLPPSLWQSAVELARCHGLYVVARSLKLDYSTLKRHLNGSAEGRGTRKKAEAKFIEPHQILI